jgi:hypothetical protein
MTMLQMRQRLPYTPQYLGLSGYNFFKENILLSMFIIIDLSTGSDLILNLHNEQLHMLELLD